MSTTTTNYGLVKPALTDAPPDITVMNPNWDTIDAQLKSLTDKVNTPQNITPEGIGAAPANHGNHVPTTQTADNATFLRNDNTWQKVTPANIGAAESNHGHDLEELGTVKLYRYLEQLGLTTATATTNAIIQAMDVNSIAILDVTTSWTAATEIPSKYSTMVIYKRYNGRTSGTLTAVASEHIWFGSQHSGGSFAGWKEQYGEHNISALATALGAAKIQTGSYDGTGAVTTVTIPINFAPKFLFISADKSSATSAYNGLWINSSSYMTTMDFDNNVTKLEVTKSGNNISWNISSTSNATKHLNASSTKYNWVAIG